MTEVNRWLLPDGVDELLPPEAWKAEFLRRTLLDLYRGWGYELISPPLIEFLESLYTGTGNDLDLQTFKVTDQLSGRMMGVRADITPQAARIDAHCLKSQGVSRLCYADAVLHTKPENQLKGRTPLQVGCELFGSAELGSDVEVLRLMVETLKAANAPAIHVDLSHVGISRSLLDHSALSPSSSRLVRDALARKSVPDLVALVEALALDSELAAQLTALPRLTGDASVLATARAVLDGKDERIEQALNHLETIGNKLASLYPDIRISYDLCELRGYNYHTGLVFTGFGDFSGYAVAKGGRYDRIGKDFGSARPATGFSVDLKSLVHYLDRGQQSDKIYAPGGEDPALDELIRSLRAEHVVLQAVGVDETPERSGCARQIVNIDGTWQVVPVSEQQS